MADRLVPALAVVVLATASVSLAQCSSGYGGSYCNALPFYVGGTNYVGAWTGKTWKQAGSTPSAGVEMAAFEGSLYALQAVCSPNPSVPQVSQLYGNMWSTVIGGCNQAISAMTATNGTDGHIYVAAVAIGALDDTLLNIPTAWTQSSEVSTVTVLTTFNGNLVAGGILDGFPDGNIAQLEGSSWVGFGSGPAFAVAGWNPITAAVQYGASMVAGTAQYVSGYPSILQWTGGASWSALGTGVDGGVNALVSYGSAGTAVLVAGGSFQNAGGVATGPIAQWDGAAWSALGAGLGSSASVQDLLVYASLLLVAGTFESAGGHAAKNVAQWDGSTWSALGDGAAVVGPALSLAVFCQARSGYYGQDCLPCPQCGLVENCDDGQTGTGTCYAVTPKCRVSTANLLSVHGLPASVNCVERTDDYAEPGYPDANGNVNFATPVTVPVNTIKIEWYTDHKCTEYLPGSDTVLKCKQDA